MCTLCTLWTAVSLTMLSRHPWDREVVHRCRDTQWQPGWSWPKKAPSIVNLSQRLCALKNTNTYPKTITFLIMIALNANFAIGIRLKTLCNTQTSPIERSLVAYVGPWPIACPKQVPNRRDTNTLNTLPCFAVSSVCYL